MSEGSQKRQLSAKPASPTNAPPEKTIQITIKNVMEGKPQVKIDVPAVCLVRDLKAKISEACEVAIEKQLLLYKNVELKNDDSPISLYDIRDNCTITMNVKMNTGVSRGSASSSIDLIFYVPPSMPQSSVSDLRSVIKVMNTVKSRPKKVDKSVNKNTQIWTQEKQFEHELTRNRMKSLLKNRKKTTILSSPPIDSASGSAGSSVIGSRASYSPLATPPPELASGQGSNEPTTPSPITPTTPTVEQPEVTEKELKLYFEPAESLHQLLTMRRDMYDPPQNEQELNELKKKLELVAKTKCGFCNKKLPLSEQTMLCLCKKAFCLKHRNPDKHLCNIDTKQTGRGKLQKENPKIGNGGKRKAKL